MAHMTQEKKAAIAASLKKIMPKGWKYTLGVRDHSGIVLTIASAPVDLLAIVRANREHGLSDTYTELNQYYLDREFKGNSEMCELFEKIRAALKGADFYDNSDSQRDYFDVSHYLYIKIGKYNRPFVVTGSDGKPLISSND